MTRHAVICLFLGCYLFLREIRTVMMMIMIVSHV